MLPCGGVEEVKVAQHGGSPVVRAISNNPFTMFLITLYFKK